MVFEHAGPVVSRFVAAGIRTSIAPQLGECISLGEFGETANLLNITVYGDSPDIDRAQKGCGLPTMITLQWYTRLRVRPLPIICASSAVAAIQDRANEVTMIRNGIDTQKFQPDTRQKRSRKVVARVCRANKSSPFFRTVIQMLLQQRPEIELWLIGESGESTEQIKYFGIRDDVHELLRSVDVLVHTPMPRQGAHDLAVLEAMATGIPVVAFDVECVRECFLSPESGILVPYGDVKAMVAQLIRLVDDDRHRQQISRAARDTALKHFDIRDVAERYCDVFRSLLRRSAANRAIRES